jgi:hypothetical protein
LLCSKDSPSLFGRDDQWGEGGCSRDLPVDEGNDPSLEWAA